MTEAERHQRIKRVFAAAVDLPPGEREPFVREQCGGDDELRDEIMELLRHDALDRRFTDAVGGGRQLSELLEPEDPAAATLPETIDGYRITGLLGSGGMGVVYSAEQASPRRTVALKVMRRSLLSRSALRRFAFESQLLGRLGHPGIAQIYEAGMHDDGTATVPFFAMEFVPQAHSITEFARRRRLDLRERLELFAQVCDAVGHGHQRGIIHRDLKPSNILVDGGGQVRVIDFGVARATDADVTIATVATGARELVGTLQYMSPEQCDADPDDIDTRSDVYSLGVVLYELLAGRLPYRLEGRPAYDAMQMLRTFDPPRPGAIDRSLRGDPETIVMKALEKQRERRYASAEALAADIRRSLAYETIEARPPSVAYQLSRFARRHTAWVVGAAAALALLVTGTVLVSLALGRALRAEQDAQRQAGNAGLIADFATGMLESVTPRTARGRDTELLRMVLDDAAGRVGEELAAYPEGEATLRSTIGMTYRAIGAYDLAEPEVRRALELQRGTLGDEHADTMMSMVHLGEVLHNDSRLDEAEEQFRAALALQRRVLGDDHMDTLNTMNHLATLLQSQGKLAEAEPVYRMLVETCRRVLGPEHQGTLATMVNLSGLLQDQGKLDEGTAPLVEATEAFERTLGADHPNTLTCCNNVGRLMLRLDRLDEAERWMTRAVEGRRRVMGADHPETLISIDGLGHVYLAQGRLDEAGEAYREALDGRRAQLGDEHRRTLDSLSSMGRYLRVRGRLDEAETLLREALDAWTRTMGGDHPRTLGAEDELGTLLLDRGALEEARAHLETALAGRRAQLGETHPSALETLAEAARLEQAEGRLDEAVDAMRVVVDALEEQLGAAHRQTLAAKQLLGSALVERGASGDLAEADGLLAAVLEARRSVLSEEHPDVIGATAAVGRLRLAEGEAEEARTMLEAAVDADRRVLGPAHWRTGVDLSDLGAAQAELGERAEAERTLRDARAVLEASLAEGDGRRRLVEARLAALEP